jgi:hypothetical protein
MSKREWQIRTRCSGEHVDVSAVDVLYLLGVIDTIRADRNRLRNKANAADAEPESKKPHAGGNAVRPQLAFLPDGLLISIRLKLLLLGC